MKNVYIRDPKVSVVIVNVKGLEYLKGCLKSLLNTDYPDLEVIVVDFFTSRIKSWMRKNFPQVKLRHYNYDIGLAAARNVGVKASTGKYVAFLDNDTKMDPRWLKELVKVLKSDLKIGVAQSKLLLMRDHGRFCCAGGFIDVGGFVFSRGYGEDDKGQYDQICDIFSARGASMIFKRNALDEIGLFDPKFFISTEEGDICWRAWLRGYRVVFVPTSIVYHDAKKRVSRLRSFHRYKNQIAMLLKNYNSHNLIRYFLLYLIRRHCSVIVYHMLVGDIDEAVTRCKALFWNTSNFRYLWKERLKVQNLIRKVPDEDLIHKKKLIVKGRPVLLD